jgi:hypothetical protein
MVSFAKSMHRVDLHDDDDDGIGIVVRTNF